VTVLLLALALAAPASAPVPITETARAGDVSGELTYMFDEASENFDARFTRLHLRIRRGDAPVFDRDVRPLCGDCVAWPVSGGDPGASSVVVKDLDADGEPEVLLDLSTGGAHCCVYTTFFRATPAGYAARAHSWGNPSYRLRDLGSDGRPEFVTGDDRFNYAFSCYACSAVPIKIQRYTASGLVNVTRNFRAQIRMDAARAWISYRRAVKLHVTPAGLLPAYFADEYGLGRGKAGWARIRAAVARADWSKVVEPQWRSRARYLAALRRFLVRTGYAR
jgi:hypothetical protein